MSSKYKFVVFVPLSHADEVRRVIGEAGGGRLGSYSFASFSSRGIGRFKPEEGAHPAIGEMGRLETVEEERIEVVVAKDVVQNVIEAVKKVHPYEEIAYDLYPLEELRS